VNARAFPCDVSDKPALEVTLSSIRAEMPPLHGVIHAAMELDDALIANLDAGQVRRVLAPKLGAALYLDALTRRDPIDFFVLYSSAVTVLGAPGQASYVAANLALEGIARRRRAQGLPALAVGWGPIGDRGYLARHGVVGDSLARRLAANPFAAEEALDALPWLWATGQPVLAYASIRWDSARRALPILNSPTFQDFAGDDKDDDVSLRERLVELPPDECHAAVLAILSEEVGRILSGSSSDLDPRRPITELGMDSLMAVELRLSLESRLGTQLPLFSLSQQTSLATIADRITQNLLKPIDIPSEIARITQLHESADPEATRLPRDRSPAPIINEAAAS
jgi:acyl carrier protein